MKYRKYSAEDFALDVKFQKWVLDPDPEVTGFWEEWLQENPGQNPVVKDAIELVRAAGLSKDHHMNEDYLTTWHQIQQNVSQSGNRSSNRTWQYVKIAAVLSFVVVSSFVLWRVFQDNARTEFQTSYGEIKDFVLEDGSKVTLNSNSHLYLSSDWSESEIREVTLEGEAFFDVVKTRDKKGFEVATNEDVRISVLGTKFNVNTRHEEVKVYLQSGQVKVNSGIGEATLLPGDFVMYKTGNSSLMINRQIKEATQLLSWKEEIFVFNDTPLADVVDELEDNYGFSVVLQDAKLNEKRITAKIPRKDVDVLLNVLSETLDIKIQRDGKQLTLK
jgi:transmembrane sensor